MKTKKGFNLIEILITMTLIGIMAVGLLPVLTKRAQRSNDPDCLNGYKMVQKIYNYNRSGGQQFVVPENIAGPVSFTIIDGGENGADGTSSDCNNGTHGTLTSNTTCSLISLQTKNEQDTRFYYNVIYNAVKSGGGADCANGKAGDSGDYIYNNQLTIEKYQGDNLPQNVFSHSINSSDGLYTLNGVNKNFSWQTGIVGDSTSSLTLKRLLGGASPVIIGRAGIGQGCNLNDAGSAYENDISATSGACKITCRIGTPGEGGKPGAYMKFDIAPSFNSCTIVAGKGGGNDTERKSSVTCGNSLYDSEHKPQGAVSYSSQNGKDIDVTKISGGQGGDVMNDTVIYSPGAKGGCDGSTNSSECSNPNGGNGKLGSGGGGGSCNENGCGAGGRGGDGLVVVEYKEQCK